MDEQERSRLLIEKENAENDLKDLRFQLTQMGEYLVRFGENVRKNPEKVIFPNAPMGLGDHPGFGASAPRFIWNEIPDKETIARLIQEVRKTLDQIESITLKLRL